MISTCLRDANHAARASIWYHETETPSSEIVPAALTYRCASAMLLLAWRSPQPSTVALVASAGVQGESELLARWVSYDDVDGVREDIVLDGFRNDLQKKPGGAPAVVVSVVSCACLVRRAPI